MNQATNVAALRMEDVRQVGARINRGTSWIWAAVRRGDFPGAAPLVAKVHTVG